MTTDNIEEIIKVSRKIKEWYKSDRVVDKDISPYDEDTTFTGSFENREFLVNYTKCMSLWIRYSITIQTEDGSSKNKIIGQYSETYWQGASEKKNQFLQLQQMYHSIEQRHIVKSCLHFNQKT